MSLWSCLSQSNKQPAKDFFHFHPLKQIAPELGVSAGAVRDWRIFLNKGDFAWISERNVLSRRPQVIAAVADWITNYPIGYTDAAKAHGVRPSDVYREFQPYLKVSPSAKLPLKLRHSVLVKVVVAVLVLSCLFHFYLFFWVQCHCSNRFAVSNRPCSST